MVLVPSNISSWRHWHRQVSPCALFVAFPCARASLLHSLPKVKALQGPVQPCCTMLYHAMLCCSMPRCVMLCHVMTRYAIPTAHFICHQGSFLSKAVQSSRAVSLQWSLLPEARSHTPPTGMWPWGAGLWHTTG